MKVPLRDEEEGDTSVILSCGSNGLDSLSWKPFSLPGSLMVAEQGQHLSSLRLLSFQCQDGVFSVSPVVTSQ